jgi:hypothetical protein
MDSSISSKDQNLVSARVPSHFNWPLLHFLNLTDLTNSLTHSFTHSLIHCMEQSRSWNASSSSVTQKIPRIVWKTKVHYCIHRCPPFARILSWIIQVLAIPDDFFKVNLNIIFLSTPSSFKWSLSFRLLRQNPVCTCLTPHICYMPRQSHFSSFDHPGSVWWGV